MSLADDRRYQNLETLTFPPACVKDYQRSNLVVSVLFEAFPLSIHMGA